VSADDRFVAAIDQGTTSTRCVLVDVHGRFAAAAQMEHEQILPRPGWVEHDPGEIWSNTQTVLESCLDQLNLDSSAIVALGITNQRETTVAWDEDGTALSPAIVWQDTRTARECSRLGGDVGADRFRSATGLPLATYFSGPKMRWLLDHNDEVAAAAERGSLRLGTIDSWLAWNLTGRHLTDVTNASRTMLMGLESLAWDDGLLGAFGVPRSALPTIVPSIGTAATVQSGPLTGVPLAGILGDQQAALFGQGCFTAGSAKNTYGTGCFMLLNTGESAVASEHGLLTTVAYQAAAEPARYALEGSVAVAGAAVQWLRDNLGMIASAPEVEELASTVDDNGDVYFVPAFSGLFAPHWRPDARGLLAGLTRFSRSGHIARAVLEAVAYQTQEVLAAMEADSGLRLSELKVDGGMVGNEVLMQFQADLLDIPVVRPTNTETTVLGAAYAAGLAVGFWDGMDEVTRRWEEDRRFDPAMDDPTRRHLQEGWAKALERSLGWVEDV
jgi:glycerol kinase